MRNNNKDFHVIVLGGDHYNTYGIVRSLGEQGIKSDVLILGQEQKSSFVLKSKYIGKGVICLSHERAIEHLAQNYDNTTENIIICCSDEAEELVIAYYDVLSALFILPVSKMPQETKRLMNKMNINSFAQECGLKTPKSWEIYERRIPNDIVYPCLTKPMESTHGHKSDIVVCNNRKELNLIVSDMNRCSDFIVQEFIQYDKEISILGTVLQNGEVVLSGCIDKLRTCMIGTSSFAVMVENSILGDNIEKLKSLMKRSGYKGLFSAEFLKTKDQLYFLEVNFRNDGNTYVATTSGQNLPYLYVMSCIGKNLPFEKTPHYPCYFMLEIEDFRKRRKNGVSLHQWIKDFQKANCCLVYNKNDIMPFKKKMMMTLSSKIKIIKIILRKIGLIK